MSEYKKFSVAERAYGRGRRAKFVENNPYIDTSFIDAELLQLGILASDKVEYSAAYEAWVKGFVSKTEHNPLPTKFQFEAPPIIQKIKFDNETRGVVMAHVRRGNIWIGWSVRNLLDKFDPEKAVVDARVNSMPLTKFNENKLPKFYSRKEEWVAFDVFGDGLYETFEDRVRYTVYKVIGRALHYYQQFNLSSITNEY